MTIEEWTDTTIVQRNPKAVWRMFERELAVLDPAVGRLSTLNEVGTRCWELADGRTFQSLVDQLVNEFEVGRIELEADTRRFLNLLLERGLLSSQ